MQTQIIVAEQTNRNRYWRPAPLPPREIELSMRLQVPEGDGADVGIKAAFPTSFPEAWEDMLHQRLYDGVHGGLATIDEPLPTEGIGVHITHLRVSPPLDADSSDEDARRLGDMLQALTASTVAALWAGLISLGAPSAA